MSKHLSKKRRLKYVLLALTCTAAFSVPGFASACKPAEEDPEDDKKTTKEDTQLLKNGNFEFFNVPEKEEDGNEPVYLINTPNNWTRNGTSSYTMSGIIDTNKTAWDLMSGNDLKDKLDANNELDKKDSGYKDLYVDYNGMKSSDIPYRDTYAALNDDKIEDAVKYFGLTEENGKYYYNGTEVYYEVGEKDVKIFYFDEDLTQPLTRERIPNPGTHYNLDKDSSGYFYTDAEGERVDVYKDDNGDYFLNKDGEKYSGTFTNVLMLHNYSNSAHNGIAQNYSSVSVTLPANTSAEISVWVKTQNLFYHGGETVTQDRGAYISVSHTVGSTSLDDFKITNINTQKLLGDSQKNNGWVEYTVYVNACDFASSTVSLKLGLGEDDKPVEGYAFFDDITVTQFNELENEDCTYSANEAEINKHYNLESGTQQAFASINSDASEKVFKTDVYRRNDKVIAERFSQCRHFLLDLASHGKYTSYDFGGGVKAGLTVDDKDYVSSTDNSFAKNFLGKVTVKETGKVKLPAELKNMPNGLDTSSDLIALVSADKKFTSSETDYYERLNEILFYKDGDTEVSSVASLPNADSNTQTLLMLSARGAGYTSSFEFKVGAGERKIISFWVKTSDMEGGTASTIKLTDANNEDTTASLTLDTTGKKTKLGDNEDIYNGWVQCFFFVNNEDDNEQTGEKTLKLELSFGNTTINGTAVSAYKAGWGALTNVHYLDAVDEDIYELTSTGDTSGSLVIPENPAKNTNVFAEVYGNQSNDIKENIVKPSGYSGVNGGSSNIVNNGAISLPFDSIDTNKYAGLINRDYVDGYMNGKGAPWYETLLNNFGVQTSGIDSQTSWNKVFDEKAYQPLIIINKLRKYTENVTADKDNYTNYYIEDAQGDIETFDGKKYRKATSSDEFDEDTKYYTLKDVLNYGYLGSSATVNANSYSAVSVRVKVSKGAVAYVYLADTSAGNAVLGFDTPAYTFWYDEDGNVLKGEIDEDASLADRKANILYSLRTDGLYEDAEGNLYANTWNYTKLYKDQTVTYYDEDGKPISFEDLKKGETYYADSAKTKMANHFLVNGKGVKLYEYKDGNYHYIVDGKTQDSAVHPFKTEYARYSSISEKYTVCIDARYDKDGKYFTDPACGELGYDKNGKKVSDKWITVTFVIHTGSDSKSYRLELWSGSRENTGVNEDGTTEFKADSSVIFDYSYTSVADDTLKTYYENEIIKAYQKLLIENGVTEFDSSAENISYYEKLAKEHKLTVDGELLNSYKARYLTYSLYDSANYQPFNADTADETSTGYDYKINDWNETLAYLEISEDDAYTVFADYATVNQNIELGVAEEEEEEETEEENNSNIWLLVSSILLVVALVFAMLAILAKDMMKKSRHNKITGKNTYDHNKVNRYMRKLKISKEEIEEVEAPAEAQPEADETVDETADEANETAEPEQTEEEPADEGENKDE